MFLIPSLEWLVSFSSASFCSAKDIATKCIKSLSTLKNLNEAVKINERPKSLLIGRKTQTKYTVGMWEANL